MNVCLGSNSSQSLANSMDLTSKDVISGSVDDVPNVNLYPTYSDPIMNLPFTGSVSNVTMGYAILLVLLYTPNLADVRNLHRPLTSDTST